MLKGNEVKKLFNRLEDADFEGIVFYMACMATVWMLFSWGFVLVAEASYNIVLTGAIIFSIVTAILWYVFHGVNCVRVKRDKERKRAKAMKVKVTEWDRIIKEHDLENDPDYYDLFQIS